MAITIVDYHNNQLTTGGNDGSVVSGDFATRVASAFYINYTKGDEADLKIYFGSYFKYLEDWYPICYDTTDTNINPIVKTLSESGKYQIKVPLAVNETVIRIYAQFENIPDNGTAGTANIMISPVIPTI